ncbi:hypothetical protein C8R43DRAFT_1108137 [Mycena crocata]|nr:hypothetical protein C8R43DRAFT_1108137 [Mycena crocata]
MLKFRLDASVSIARFPPHPTRCLSPRFHSVQHELRNDARDPLGTMGFEANDGGDLAPESRGLDARERRSTDAAAPRTDRTTRQHLDTAVATPNDTAAYLAYCDVSAIRRSPHASRARTVRRMRRRFWVRGSESATCVAWDKLCMCKYGCGSMNTTRPTGGIQGSRGSSVRVAFEAQDDELGADGVHVPATRLGTRLVTLRQRDAMTWRATRVGVAHAQRRWVDGIQGVRRSAVLQRRVRDWTTSGAQCRGKAGAGRGMRRWMGRRGVAIIVPTEGVSICDGLHTDLMRQRDSAPPLTRH